MKKRRRSIRRSSRRDASSRYRSSAHSSKVEPGKRRSRKAQFSKAVIASLQVHGWTEGMDVSKNQDVDWTQIDTSSVKFVIIKATEGINHVDPNFQVNWSAAWQLSSLKRGAYHFFKPDDDVNGQIDLIRRTVHLQPVDLPISLDVENSEYRKLTPQDVPVLAQMLQSLIGLFNQKPIIYIANDAWTSLGSPTSSGGVSFADFPLWIAHYTRNPFPSYPSPWIQWLIWQYKDDGSIGGVNKPGSDDPTQVDLDRFNGSPDALIRLAALS